MKTIVSLLFLTALFSCKKTTTTPTNNQIGIAYAGGTYTSGLINYTDYPYTDPNATIDVKYIDSFKLDLTINTKLNLPNYLKHFTADLKYQVSETKTYASYQGQYDDFSNKHSDSIILFNGGLTMMQTTNFLLNSLTIGIITKKFKELSISNFQKKN